MSPSCLSHMPRVGASQDLAASLAKEEELARIAESGTMKEAEEKQSWREELQESNANQLLNFNIMVQGKAGLHTWSWQEREVGYQEDDMRGMKCM